jgi:hypothetical protein
MAVDQTNYMDRFLQPITELLTPEALRRIIAFRFDADTETRAGELAEKANEGLLTDEERSEYSEYIEAVDLIGIIQASARSMLARNNG